MSMLLKGDNGPEFELGFIQERFQVPQDGFGDSAWVTVTFRVSTDDISWEETAPVVNIFELKNLFEWLSAVGRGTPEVAEVELLEPELKFSISQDAGDVVTIRINFNLADRPEEFEVDAPTDEADHVDIRLAREQVRTAAAELNRDLQSALVLPAGDNREEDDGGIMGEPDGDLNILPEGAEGFVTLEDQHDDIGAVDESDEPGASSAFADEEDELEHLAALAGEMEDEEEE
jgi:hypothetical protein